MNSRDRRIKSVINIMYAIFETEKDARQFIIANYGKDAVLTPATVSDGCNFDVDEMSISWSGETSAYEVNDGEAYVGFWEAPDEVYTITFNGVSETTDRHSEAQRIADSIKELAESYNVAGTIIIKSSVSDFYDEIEVEQYDSDEPADEKGFYNDFTRMKIGKAIRAARIEQRMSIRELAAAAGMSKNNVVRIEDNAYNYTIDNLNAICRVLNLNISID